MNSLVKISNVNVPDISTIVDITKYIDWASYHIESNDMYQSWTDGNFVEHRIYSRSRISGSFRVWLCGKNDMDIDLFMQIWNSAVTNHVITLGVYDNISNSMKAINAYYHISPQSHREMNNGEYFDVLTIEVTEK